MKTSPEIKALKDAYAKTFVKRVKLIREAAELEADDVAAHLGVPKDTYYRYESKVVMPHALIGRFLSYCDGDLNYLMGLSKHRRKPRLKSIE